jgi:hypothetical protein
VIPPDPLFVAGLVLGDIRAFAAAAGKSVKTVEKWVAAGQVPVASPAGRDNLFHWPTYLVTKGGVPESLAIGLANGVTVPGKRRVRHGKKVKVIQ